MFDDLFNEADFYENAIFDRFDDYTEGPLYHKRDDITVNPCATCAERSTCGDKCRIRVEHEAWMEAIA